ncbi:MAG TPA: carboxypeptidase-like regulatory domain-containing protein, partial [Vicinamibacterales bacterium]|nr:carboxypeptidase-like regulatory domain-containing protein [Vicinamibacterales bacterium]
MSLVRAARALVAVAILACAVPLYAQQTGSITGKVTDSSGGVLPGVTVEARSNVLPGPRDAVTGGDGAYQLAALPPGNYTITYTLSGMQTVTKKAVVRLGEITTADAALGVGGVTESVNVTAG